MVPFPELEMGHGLHTPPPVPVINNLEGHLRKKHSPADVRHRAVISQPRGSDGARPGEGTELELMEPEGHSLKDSCVPIA